MTLLFGTVAGLHLALGMVVAFVLRRRRGARRPATPGSEPVVCLVAARNEEDNIDGCLEALCKQLPPVSVIVIDDGSEDATFVKAEAWLDRFDGRLQVIRGGPGKSLALQAGFESSSAPIVLTTDADCRPPVRWASHLAGSLRSRDLGALGGATMVRGRGLLSAVETLDWAILLGVASTLSHGGRPMTAMGNNMALDRESILAVGGFGIGASSVTEDYVLFRTIGRRRPTALSLEAEHLNWTRPVGSFSGIFRQRRRWAIGGSAGPVRNSLIAAGALLAYAGPWILLGLAPLLGASLVVLRWLTHATICTAVSGSVETELPLSLIPVHDVLISVYAVCVPLSLPFARQTTWKGRKLTEGAAYSAGAEARS